MTTYRRKLEEQRDQLLTILESGEKALSRTLRKQLGNIAEEFEQLDAGEHWTQQESDTKTNIKVAGLDLSKKTINQNSPCGGTQRE